MHAVEKFALALRHNRYLERSDRLWNCVRPVYDRLSSIAASRGLTRVINGTDKILVSPRWRMVSEVYEPEVWRHLMSQVRAGDVVADVGAYIGLYTVALAKRVGPSGRVIAFEPNSRTCDSLLEHLQLNSVADRVQLIQAGLAATSARARFEAREDHSRVIDETFQPDEGTDSVECVTLDNVIGNGQLNLMKIDVEGYEERVLKGASHLLSDPERCPRAIYIEVHPHLWSTADTDSKTLLATLDAFQYRAQHLDGRPVELIENHGQVVAFKVT
jgi:FkbM family methyltransferase